MWHFFFVKLRLCLDYATEGRYLKAKLNQKIKKWGSLETYELINAKIINLIIFILSENPLDVDPFRPISTQTTSTAGGERWSRKALVSRKGSAGVSVCVCVCVSMRVCPLLKAQLLPCEEWEELHEAKRGKEKWRFKSWYCEKLQSKLRQEKSTFRIEQIQTTIRKTGKYLLMIENTERLVWHLVNSVSLLNDSDLRVRQIILVWSGDQLSIKLCWAKLPVNLCASCSLGTSSSPATEDQSIQGKQKRKSLKYLIIKFKTRQSTQKKL